jgi:TonB family protein
VIRQLFASAGGVPTSGGPGRMAPVSVVLHGVAITAILLVSGQRVVSREVPHGPIIYHMPAKAAPASGTAAPAPQPLVRQHQQRSTRVAATVATAVPFVQPRTDDAPTTPDDPLQPDPASDASAPPCEGNCSGGTIGGDPNATGTSDGGPGGDPLPANSLLVPPRRINDVQPKYPDIARVNHIPGEVVLECVIDPNGHVTSVTPIKGNPIFYKEATDAVRQWLYTPPRLNGRPISVYMNVTVRFHIVF